MNTMAKRCVANLVGLGLIAFGSMVFLAIAGHMLPHLILTPILGFVLAMGLLFSSNRETERDERDRQILLTSVLIGSSSSWFCLAVTVSALGQFNQTVDGDFLGYALPGSAFFLILVSNISFLVMSRRGLPDGQA